MSLLRAIGMGLREIWAHKVRSLLTLFCVLLGVMSVVVTVAYMRGLTASWRLYLNERGGLERVRIENQSVPDEQEHLASLSPGKTLDDAGAMERHSSFLSNVSPAIEFDDNYIYRGDKRTRVYQLEGVFARVLEVERFEMERGRFITDLDNEFMSQVMVIGGEVQDELYGKLEDPIGTTLIFQGIPFQVVGILKRATGSAQAARFLRFKNNVAFIPLRTAQYKIQNSLQINDLDIQVADVSNLSAAVEQAHNIMLHMHRGVQDFEVTTSESYSESIEKQERSLLTAGAAISLITMVIGGIGIMNLMLASINERVREIGIRKAIGARPRDIFFQFCVESITLCVLGGFLGVAMGQGVIYWLQQVMTETDPPVFTLFGVIAGFTASVTIGVLAGIYPAFRASRLDPIEALRYE